MKIPSGNVTFLFTEIEGSAMLAQQGNETYLSALNEHQDIINESIHLNKGFVFKLTGDTFCCAFESVSSAIKAAVNAQVKLNSADPRKDIPIRVRMGIHTGNSEWNGKDYSGYVTLARTHRVMSAAYGGQIIISNNSYRSIGNEDIFINDDKITFRDFGLRRLKDLVEPVQLYQVVTDRLQSDFPPLRTLDARPNNLPNQLTGFIGREAEMKYVKDLLWQTHIITLTGPGGAGKTRFALQIAADVIDDFANGVWFVELAALSDPLLLPQALMKVFELKEEPKRSPEEILCDFLKKKEILVILDNCEHMIEGSARLAEKLLSVSPKLKIIATSREALKCSGEHAHIISPLEVPDPKDRHTPEQLTNYEAVRLFIERASAVNDKFTVSQNNSAALAEICYRLDGIPLAIELAAARTKILTVEKIDERLNNRFKLLTGGKRTSLQRQQTLKALIDWSYDLLSEKEKILWSRLSVFTGGWNLESVEDICADGKNNKRRNV